MGDADLTSGSDGGPLLVDPTPSKQSPKQHFRERRLLENETDVQRLVLAVVPWLVQ